MPFNSSAAGNSARPIRAWSVQKNPAVRLALSAMVLFGGATLALRVPDIRGAEEPRPAAPAPQGNGPPIVVAVLPLTTSAPDDHFKPLVDAMGDMLISQLSHYPNLKLVERVDLDKVLNELALGSLQKPDEQVRLGKLLKAQYVIVGGVIVQDKKLQINLRAVEVTTARVAGGATGGCSADKVLESLGKIGDKLIQEMNLDLPELPPNRVDTSANANLHFMRGLGFYFAQMPEDAGVEFMQALAIDPGHARARWWEAQTYFDADEYGHARLELVKFLHDHPDHAYAPRAKSLLARCDGSKPAGK